MNTDIPAISENEYNAYAKAWANGYTNVDYFYRCFIVHDGEECQLFDGMHEGEILEVIDQLEVPAEIKTKLHPILLKWWLAYFDFNSDNSSAYWSTILNLVEPYITNRDLASFDVAWEDVMFAAADKLSFAEFQEQYL